jgi:hypothetical protein
MTFTFSRENEKTVIPEVVAIQRCLIAKGYDLGRSGADGKFGPRTEKAVQEYQRSFGIPDTGVVELITWNALARECPSFLNMALDDPGLPDNPAILYADDDSPDDRPLQPPFDFFTTQPLPASLNNRYSIALASIEQAVDASNDPRKWRYKCWLEKLKAPNCDDRMIEWDRIYPNIGVAPYPLIGPRDLLGPSPIGQDIIEYNIRSIQDLETKGDSIHLFEYLKSNIVRWYELGGGLSLENFRYTHDRVVKTPGKLEVWSTSEFGGASGMAPAYQSIKAWMRQRQLDSRSIYSCL